MVNCNIYGNLLRLEKCMTPVYDTTDHECINGKVTTYMDS